jgi:hypothetical protein
VITYTESKILQTERVFFLLGISGIDYQQCLIKKHISGGRNGLSMSGVLYRTENQHDTVSSHQRKLILISQPIANDNTYFRILIVPTDQ